MELRYLALGDSYTVGEGAAPADSWPRQLAAELRQEGLPLADPVVLAATGWTSRDLLNSVRKQDFDRPFHLVTLQIGVNNQYRGLPLAEYESELAALIGEASRLASGQINRLIVVSIPDWSVTPFARDRNPSVINEELRAFNAALRQAARRHAARHLDITSLSQRAAADEGLLVEDGLHPATEMYRTWVERIRPLARDILAAQLK